MPTTLVLVRHGETDWNRERRFQGHADMPLNDTGRRQARELADALRDEGLTAVYTSPLRRASETAGIVADRLGLEAEELEALREIDVGDWQGLTVDEVKTRFPERADVAWRSGWPNGETHEQLRARVLPALLDLAAAPPGCSRPRRHARRAHPGRAGRGRGPLAGGVQIAYRPARELRGLPIRASERRTRAS